MICTPSFLLKCFSLSWNVFRNERETMFFNCCCPKQCFYCFSNIQIHLDKLFSISYIVDSCVPFTEDCRETLQNSFCKRSSVLFCETQQYYDIIIYCVQVNEHTYNMLLSLQKNSNSIISRKKLSNIEKNFYAKHRSSTGTWNHLQNSNPLPTLPHSCFNFHVKYVALRNKIRPLNGKYFPINVRIFLTLWDLALFEFLILNNTS